MTWSLLSKGKPWIIMAISRFVLIAAVLVIPAFVATADEPLALVRPFGGALRTSWPLLQPPILRHLVQVELQGPLGCFVSIDDDVVRFLEDNRKYYSRCSTVQQTERMQKDAVYRRRNEAMRVHSC